MISETVGRTRVVGLLGLQALVAVLEGTGLILLVPVIQALDGSARFSVPALDVELDLVEAFALVVVVAALRGCAMWLATVKAVEYRLATIDRIRLGLIDDLYTSDWSYLAGQRRSHVIQGLTTEVERAQAAIAMVPRLLVGTFVLLATAAVAVLIAPVVGGLALVAVVVVVLVASRSTRQASKLGHAMSERMTEFGAALTDSFASVRVMRAHGAEQAWSDLVGAEAARVRDVRRRFVARSATTGAVLGVVAVLAVLVLVVIGREIDLSLAELATLIVVATRLLTSAQNLMLTAQGFANEVPALERLADFRVEARNHPETSLDVPGPAGTSSTDDVDVVPLLELRGVTVRYDDAAPPALTEVDLRVPRHSLVTVVGPSGSGKSTLLDVVLGLLRAQEGAMLVDGEPVADLAGWRARIGYVPQQTVLVPGTVWQNLVWSLQPGRTLTEEQAWAALETARLASVIRGLPGGLHAPLAEVAGLSGGEQQRLCIARALVREPELLVLDEATNALDRATEAALLAGLLDGSRAVLMVTHRAVDQGIGSVVRLEDGRVQPA